MTKNDIAMEFKKGDIITHKPDVPGFSNIEVTMKDSNYYYCAIHRGTITIPIRTVEENYIMK